MAPVAKVVDKIPLVMSGTYSHATGEPKLPGVPFNNAYHYMDRLLTVPLLLMRSSW